MVQEPYVLFGECNGNLNNKVNINNDVSEQAPGIEGCLFKNNLTVFFNVKLVKSTNDHTRFLNSSTLIKHDHTVAGY